VVRRRERRELPGFREFI